MKGLFMKTLCVLGCLIFSGCWVRAALHPEAKRLNGLGAELLAQGRLEQAEAHFELSLEYNDCYASALHNLALAAYLRKDWARAESLEREALGCRPLVQAVNGGHRPAPGAARPSAGAFSAGLGVGPGLR